MGNFNTVASGQLFAPSASEWNRLKSAARQAEQNKLNAGPTHAPKDDVPAGSLIVLNNSSEIVPQYGVLKWDSVTIKPADNLTEFKARLAINAQKPDANGDEARRPFFIAQEPIGPRQIGRCIGDGFTIAKVDVLSEDHLYVECTGSSDHLRTAINGSGIATIHFRERTGTGVMFCVIRIGSPSNVAITTSGGNGGAGCCCAENRCLRLPGHPTLPKAWSPEYYTIRHPAMMCGCSPAGSESADVKLYQVDPDNDRIWESKHGYFDTPLLCLGSNQESVTCTVTATWTWTLTDDTGFCTGHFDWHVANRGDGLGTWAVGNNAGIQTDPCHCSNGGAPCGDNGSPPSSDATLLSIGTETTKPCCNPEGANPIECSTCDPVSAGHWVLTSVDDEACDCDPVEPDFDGTTEGQTATTTCDATKIVDGSELLLTSYWRLTIVDDLDYYGCDSTMLQFVIGNTTIMTYFLATPCGGPQHLTRSFCRECINTFKSSTCNARCETSPTVICLEPVVEGGGLIPCSACKDNIVPKRFIALITQPDGSHLGPYLIDITSECRGGVQFDLPDQPTDGVCSLGYYIAVEAGLAIATFGCTGFVAAHNFVVDQDLTVGDGCNQILTYTNVDIIGPFGGPVLPPDGTVLTLYPLVTSLPA